MLPPLGQYLRKFFVSLDRFGVYFASKFLIALLTPRQAGEASARLIPGDRSSGKLAREQEANEINQPLSGRFQKSIEASLAHMKKDTTYEDRELVCRAKFCTTERRVVYQTKS